MPTVSSVDRAREIALEVASYRPDYAEKREHITQDLGADRWFCRSEYESSDDRNLAVGILAFMAFHHSHKVIRQADQHLEPRGRVSNLTRRTLAMTAFAGTPALPALENVLDDCCLAAELLFVNGLEHHRLGKLPNPNHAAALVLHDADGEPFAYQKAVGLPYAYVWRDGVMQTNAGRRSLLAGSIVKPIYTNGGNGTEPTHEKFAGAGLVGVAGCVADDVEFKRFSLQLLPDNIRTAALMDAAAEGAYDDYRHHVAEARAMTDAMFAGHIAELAGSSKGYFVEAMPAQGPSAATAA